VYEVCNEFSWVNGKTSRQGIRESAHPAASGVFLLPNEHPFPHRLAHEVYFRCLVFLATDLQADITVCVMPVIMAQAVARQTKMDLARLVRMDINVRTAMYLKHHVVTTLIQQREQQAALLVKLEI